MKIKFSIHYRTEWGQQLAVQLSYAFADGATRAARVPMLTDDGEHWQAETSAVESRRAGTTGAITRFSYLYTVEDAEGHELRRECTLVPRTFGFDSTKTYVMADQWHDLPLPAHLYSKAYLATNQAEPLGAEQPQPLFRKTLLFCVSAPQLLPGQQLAVVGSHPVLGAWNPARYQLMQPAGSHVWTLTLNADALLLPIEYKYVVVDGSTRQLLQWEEGDNRTAEGAIADGEVHVLSGEMLRLKEKPWRAAGICVPVFALRSEGSCGVGDFGDLCLLADWAAQAGMKVIQLLPLNDTTVNGQWGDSNPYNITAAFDLHPHYLDLRQLPALKDATRMTTFRRQQRELNALPYSDFEAVDRVKRDYVSQCYEESQERDTLSLHDYVQQHLHRQLLRAVDHAHRQGIAVMGDLPIGISRDSHDVRRHPLLFCSDMQAGTPPTAQERQGSCWGFPTYQWNNDCQEWIQKRMEWMEQYFDALRLDHVAGYFRIWEIPQEQCSATMGHFSPALPLTAGEIEHLGLPFRRDFLTRPFINDRIVDRLFGIHAQYVRDNFLLRKAYGLYDLRPEVATQQLVWQHFHGKGDENSQWIRDALCCLVANVLFLEDPRQKDMFHPRIQAWQEPVFEALSGEERDAFMRIYNNFFYQRHAIYWGKTGYERLSLLQRSTTMLLCAEDLGTQPDSVEPVLDSLRILSLQVQRMPRHAGTEFAHLEANPVRSLATISTHDMAPLRLWWLECPEQAQHYYTTMLQKEGRAPQQLSALLAEEIIARHLYCPSMLCILTLPDWLAMDQELRAKDPRQERVNTPGDPYNRWQWRMHLTIEQLIAADRYNKKLRTMIVRSKR